MNNKDKSMYMNDQAVGAVMMALQKSLMEQSDIVPVLKGFKFRLSEAGLVVMNPPLVKADQTDTEETQEDA
jgi:tRNA1(Val) A37 N6-methylase TrmN6